MRRSLHQFRSCPAAQFNVCLKWMILNREMINYVRHTLSRPRGRNEPKIRSPREIYLGLPRPTCMFHSTPKRRETFWLCHTILQNNGGTMQAQHYAQLLLMGISLPWFIPAQSRPGTPAPVLSQSADYTNLAFQQAFFDAARTYGKKGCGDKALAELTATVALKNQVPANVMAAIVGIESSCNPLANNGIAVGIAQVNVLAHKDEYDFSRI